MDKLARFALISAVIGLVAVLTGCGGGESAPMPKYSITGSVTDLSSGTKVAGVTINLTGLQTATTTTDANGDFSLAGLAAGTYSVTPGMASFAFAPAAISVLLSDADRSGVAFVRQSYSISGRVTNALHGTPLAQASISVSGAQSGSAVTDANGRYTIAQLADGDYTITASVGGALVGPALLGARINGDNVSGQDFVAARQTTIATGVSFLPANAVSPAPIWHASLVVRGGNAYFSDSSNTPLKKVTVNTLAVLQDRLHGRAWLRAVLQGRGRRTDLGHGAVGRQIPWDHPNLFFDAGLVARRELPAVLPIRYVADVSVCDGSSG